MGSSYHIHIPNHEILLLYYIILGLWYLFHNHRILFSSIFFYDHKILLLYITIFDPQSLSAQLVYKHISAINITSNSNIISHTIFLWYQSEFFDQSAPFSYFMIILFMFFLWPFILHLTIMASFTIIFNLSINVASSSFSHQSANPGMVLIS